MAVQPGTCRFTFRPSEFSDYVRKGEFDFIDFGCSKGGSIKLGQTRFGGKKGLGIDIDDAKVRICREAGVEAICYDIAAIPDEKLFRFTILSHFLEHIPNPIDVAFYVRKACTISREFVYIQQPFFDADAYLARHSLKLYWSDWHGHPNHMSSSDLRVVLRDLQKVGLNIRYSIYARKPITSSDDPCVHSILSPSDQHKFDPTHPAKNTVTFTEPVYAELVCLITIGDVAHVELLRIFKIDKDNLLFHDDRTWARRSISRCGQALRRMMGALIATTRAPRSQPSVRRSA